MSGSILVRMASQKFEKCLKALERVKGIEPSYSAWKAAALPLSYTRAQVITYHARRAASTGMRRSGPLNTSRFAAYTVASINNERR
jgi:hypothetical protein